MVTRQRQLTLMLAITLLAGAIPAGTAGAPTPTPTGDTGCGQTVVHDLRTQAAIEAFNESDVLTSRLSNTKVRLVDAPGFVRLTGTNPNGYCVRFRVEISREIVTPAELGDVDSNDDQYTATWSARQNLTSGALYTLVEFTLPARSNATFAPSEARIVSLRWSGEAKKTGNSIMDTIGGLLGADDDLEQNKYEIDPENTSRVSVAKTGPDGRQIEDWHATYTLEGERHPVEQDADAPVYYVEHDDRVTFHFNDPRASVTFVANPSPIDSFTYRSRGWLSGWSEIGDLLPITWAPAVDAGGVYGGPR